MRCLLSALIILACLASIGCGDAPRVEADLVQEAPSAPSLFSKPQILAWLLESADARSPARQYNFTHTQETVGVLLTVGSAEVEDVREAAALFLERSASAEDRIGREDLLDLLVNLMVDDPNRKVHIVMNILYVQDGKLVTKDRWPSFRTGPWQRDFPKDLNDGLRIHGRRDLTMFIANRDNHAIGE